LVQSEQSLRTDSQEHVIPSILTTGALERFKQICLENAAMVDVSCEVRSSLGHKD